eukprot:31622-Chlamydomonas_euryale.AAC.1
MIRELRRELRTLSEQLAGRSSGPGMPSGRSSGGVLRGSGTAYATAERARAVYSRAGAYGGGGSATSGSF